MRYNTGADSWEHGQKQNNGSRHIYLGPCPQCGGRTFDYGGNWRCCSYNCECSAGNPTPSMGPRPSWWNTGVQVFKDGSEWCAVESDFVNLQESCAGFGKTPRDAVRALETVIRCNEDLRALDEEPTND